MASDLFAGDRAGLRGLAEALVEQRLLTKSQTKVAGGVPTAGSDVATSTAIGLGTARSTSSETSYEVAHEALLRVPPLGELILARREKFEQARILKLEARDWSASGQATARLGRTGQRLREAFELLNDADFGPDLARDGEVGVAGYLKACEAEERSQVDRQRRLIGRAFVKPARQALESLLQDHALRLAAGT